MSYNYLFATYQFIEQKLADARQRLAGAKQDQENRAYHEGRIEALCDLQRFLSTHYDSRLPRRLRRSRREHQP
ncbi:MAG: hypothetical protein C4519_05465 [Desulfobacteraceae bacterium]|nr:MAG: hypothetical protein C4519_05465 [Desulfobacteraceae bacterium]